MSEALLPRVSAGEPDAVEACMDAYGNLLWSLARRYCSNQEEAEDAVQEIFVDLWKSAERFDPKRGSEVTFVCTIARRRLIDRRRFQQRRLSPESLQNAEGEMRDVEDWKANTAEISAEAALAHRALAQLDPKERRVILLSTYQGMSHGQIAEHTGLPLGTVKTYIRRGLMRVNDMLQSRNRPLSGVGT